MPFGNLSSPVSDSCFIYSDCHYQINIVTGFNGNFSAMQPNNDTILAISYANYKKATNGNKLKKRNDKSHQNTKLPLTFYTQLFPKKKKNNKNQRIIWMHGMTCEKIVNCLPFSKFQMLLLMRTELYVQRSNVFEKKRKRQVIDGKSWFHHPSVVYPTRWTYLNSLR